MAQNTNKLLKGHSTNILFCEEGYGREAEDGNINFQPTAMQRIVAYINKKQLQV